MNNFDLGKYFDDELKALVLQLDDMDKVELIGYMVASFIKVSKLYYQSIGLSPDAANRALGDEMNRLKSALEMRVDLQKEEEKDFDFPNENTFDQFVSDATIDLYFLMNEVSKNKNGE